jgi:kynureninase
MVLANQRSLFEIPPEIAYLNCAYISPLLRASREAGQAAVARKSQDFFSDAETARSLFAELIGGDTDGVAIVPSASYGASIAAANIPVERGQTIVLLEDQFPSNVYPWRDLAERADAAVVTVPRPRVRGACQGAAIARRILSSLRHQRTLQVGDKLFARQVGIIIAVVRRERCHHGAMIAASAEGGRLPVDQPSVWCV